MFYLPLYNLQNGVERFLLCFSKMKAFSFVYILYRSK